MRQVVKQYEFQSTPPVWGATPACIILSPDTRNFNPRPPCGGRHGLRLALVESSDFNPRPPCGGRRVHSFGARTHGAISIHAPRVGGDVTKRWLFRAWTRFQSTPPVWGATGTPGKSGISFAFQSTPPVWGATGGHEGRRRRKIFQSTPPVWGATGATAFPLVITRISIHAPRVGGDSRRTPAPCTPCHFNPRPPCGGRQDI